MNIIDYFLMAAFIAVILYMVWYCLVKWTKVPDYDEAFVLECWRSDGKGGVKKQYYIKYTLTYLIFFEKIVDFDEENCGYGDCYNQIVYRDSVKEIIDKYTKEVNTRRKLKLKCKKVTKV